ncbi:transmembrane protein 62-like [Cimex lectularius]|uniref:TMEM62 C-terminal domain-containing protein n=1 Tax=Cimex lectularius TaxID=79782 RepID=A0A8I6SIB8_CIMLE|nr:transmembrane protein 62-like [Cimex lectularius]
MHVYTITINQHIRHPVYIHIYTFTRFRFGLDISAVKVAVLDESGRQKTVKQTFSLDGSMTMFSVLPRLILMLNFGSTLQLMFGLATVCSVLPLCILRYTNKTSDKKNSLVSLKSGMVKNWVRRLWILSNIDRLFFPIVLYPLYLAVGPWSVGELIEGFTGVIFIWGIFINGTYLPGSFTYGYGFLQLFLFQGPLIIFTAYSVDKRLFGKRVIRHNKITKCVLCLIEYFPFLFIFVSQLSMTYTFWLAYGTMSVLLGPMRIWPLALTIWAWFNVNSMPLAKIRSAATTWTRALDVGHSMTFSSPVA